MAEIFPSAEDLTAALAGVRSGKSIVFTNGCFDIIHPGHISLLEECSLLGDIIVVGLNTDSSIKRLKGSSRPIMDEESRAYVLSAISYVDFVVFFDEDTPLELIRKLKPDILVKGDEYGMGEIVGEDIAARTVRVSMKKGYSTSGIIENIVSNRKK